MYDFRSFCLNEVGGMEGYLQKKGHKYKDKVYADRFTSNVHLATVREYMDYIFPIWIEEGDPDFGSEDLEHDPELELDDLTYFLREEVAYWPAEERAELYCNYRLVQQQCTGKFVLERTEGKEVTREVISKMQGSIAVHMQVSIANKVVTNTPHCKCELFGYGDLAVTVYQKAGGEDTAMEK